MTYRTTAEVKHGAPPQRLCALQRTLDAFDCVVRVDRPLHRLVVEIPADDFEWIVTGGMAALFEAYGDCVAWRPRFRETGDRPAAPRLPPPRRGPS